MQTIPQVQPQCWSENQPIAAVPRCLTTSSHLLLTKWNICVGINVVVVAVTRQHIWIPRRWISPVTSPPRGGGEGGVVGERYKVPGLLCFTTNETKEGRWASLAVLPSPERRWSTVTEEGGATVSAGRGERLPRRRSPV